MLAGRINGPSSARTSPRPSRSGPVQMRAGVPSAVPFPRGVHDPLFPLRTWSAVRGVPYQPASSLDSGTPTPTSTTPYVALPRTPPRIVLTVSTYLPTHPLNHPPTVCSTVKYCTHPRFPPPTHHPAQSSPAQARPSETLLPVHRTAPHDAPSDGHHPVRPGCGQAGRGGTTTRPSLGTGSRMRGRPAVLAGGGGRGRGRGLGEPEGRPVARRPGSHAAAAAAVREGGREERARERGGAQHRERGA